MKAAQLFGIMGAITALGGGSFFSQDIEEFGNFNDLVDIPDKDLDKTSAEIAELNAKAYEVLGNASSV